MITLKLKYSTSEENKSLIKEYQRQYTSCLHFSYNRICDDPNISEISLRKYQVNLNNIGLIKSWLYQCAIKEAKQIYTSHKGRHIVFGSRKNYIKRTKNEISNSEWKELRLRSIYSIGEKNQRGNRLFDLLPDLETIIFKPSQNTKIELKLEGIGNRIHILKQLYELISENKIGLTYTLNQNYICISYDIIPKEETYISIKNRVFAVDLNSNNIGWSIVDWKSSLEYKVIDSGIIDFSKYNKFYNKCKLASNDKKKIHINNKKKHELILSIYELIKTVKHYKCEICSIEELDIKSSDKKKGRKFNRQCNNTWHRNLASWMIEKLCTINNIRIFKVKPGYSSLVGNIVYRKTGLPDQILASIEVGRRGYEFYNQYITKENKVRNNIIFPDKKEVYYDVVQSLEELNITDKIDLSLKEILDFINKKNSKLRYRVPLSDKVKVFKLKSYNIWTRKLAI